jgi:CheY-like chemotaxis protein
MIDDSQEDALFVKRALDKSGLPHQFYHALDGLEGIGYLQGDGRYSDRQKFLFPNVLLCDLKMPGMDGYAVLEWLQAHPHCKVIPTIVFSSSALETDVHKSYVLGANAYLEKPNTLDELTRTIGSLQHFWARCQVPLPPSGERCVSEPV